jgi:hypothetical protein
MMNFIQQVRITDKHNKDLSQDRLSGLNWTTKSNIAVLAELLISLLLTPSLFHVFYHPIDKFSCV